MCGRIIINRGDLELETPSEFESYFGFLPVLYEESYKELHLDSCLCQCDIDKSLRDRNIEFKKQCMDYYVGELELLDLDAEPF